MDQARPTGKLLDWKHMGNRTVGRPRQRWQEDVMEDLRNQMAGAYPKNGPSKTNWEATRLETYGNQNIRKTKTTMARRCHGRSKKAENKKLEGGS